MNENRNHQFRWTKVLAAGALATAAIIGVAGSAQAATTPSATAATANLTGYHIAGTRYSAVITDPTSYRTTTVATLSSGRSVTIDCGVRGRSVGGNTVWHHITSPVSGYIADFYTDTPGWNTFLAGEPTCGTTPPVTSPPVTSPPVTSPPVTSPPVTSPPAGTPVAVRGQTITYNQGVAGSCVFYALDRFKSFTGVYPKSFGNALVMGTSAAQNGWTVSATPRANSMAVFQPGDNGASAQYGHIVWVEQVDGRRIYIGEMNAPNAFVVTHRWIDNPAAGVRYIYAA